jgi:hypothetical protein
MIITAGARRAGKTGSGNGAFLGALAATAALVALIAIVFTGLPALMLKTCGF